MTRPSRNPKTLARPLSQTHRDNGAGMEYTAPRLSRLVVAMRLRLRAGLEPRKVADRYDERQARRVPSSWRFYPVGTRPLRREYREGLNGPPTFTEKPEAVDERGLVAISDEMAGQLAMYLRGRKVRG